MSSNSQSVTDHSAGVSSSAPPWAIVLAGCGLVVTGHVLGVAWLREPVLGLPAGLWFIGLLTTLCTGPVRARIAAWVEGLMGLIGAGSQAKELEGDAGSRHDGWWPRNRVASVCLDGATRVAAALVQLAWLPLWGGEMSVMGDGRRRLEAWLAGRTLPTRPLRVGLCLPDDEADALVSAAAGDTASRIEWFRMGGWDDPVGTCRRHLFDAAVYHDGEGPVRIVTLERPDHAAGVVEWADLVGPLTFGSLFPGRVDPAAVVIEGASTTRVRQGAGLLRALIEASATLSRSEHRLTLADRVLGRRVTDVIERPGGLSLWKSSRSTAGLAMERLASEAAAHAETWPEAAAIGIDAASAFFVASAAADAALAPSSACCSRCSSLRSSAAAMDSVS